MTKRNVGREKHQNNNIPNKQNMLVMAQWLLVPLYFVDSYHCVFECSASLPSGSWVDLLYELVAF